MDVHEEKVLLSTDGYGRVAIVRRADGLFCLYRHWRWVPDTQHPLDIEPIKDRWTTDYDSRLYDGVTPLPGLYGSVEDAESDAEQLLKQGNSDYFGGMSVNARLYDAGLLDVFAAAATARDRNTMIQLLSGVAVSEPELIVDAMLADPVRYGH